MLSLQNSQPRIQACTSDVKMRACPVHSAGIILHAAVCSCYPRFPATASAQFVTMDGTDPDDQSPSGSYAIDRVHGPSIRLRDESHVDEIREDRRNVRDHKSGLKCIEQASVRLRVIRNAGVQR